MNREASSSRGWWLALLAALLAFALFSEVGSFEFLNYDDPDYVTQNPLVRGGLSAENARAAFGFHAANWHPLTWLAHMLDVQVFGLEAGPMHLVNAGLHAINAALLVLVLSALTGRTGLALLVALLFAAHPLRVQVVAWISERKELLASTCFLALLLSYTRYARTKSTASYAASLLALALGLMSKPMLVSAPFVLLLLDVWPLGRTRNERPSRLWLEKLPHFALAGAAAVLTVLAQRAAGAIGELQALSLSERLWTAGAGLCFYLRAAFWPTGLAAFYPHPVLSGQGLLVPGLCGLGLASALSLVAWYGRAQRPELFAGWFWFLGMLVPVLGLVQVGDQGWADRYFYLPGIGLALALVFTLSRAGTGGRMLLGLAAAGALAFVSLQRLPDWRSSRALFERALAVTERNWIAHNNLGLVFLERRELARAREQFEAAAALRPRFVAARFNLGLTLEAEGQFPRAVETYQSALALQPGHAESLIRLAVLAQAQGDGAAAKGFYDRAIQANPKQALVWLGYARLLLELGEPDPAANCARSALTLAPTLVDAHVLLAAIALARGELDEAGERLTQAERLGPPTAELFAWRARWLFQKGDHAGARAAYGRAIALDPSDARARYDFGTLLMTLGDPHGAREQFLAVNDLRPGDPQAQVGLAVLTLEEGHAAEAAELLETVLARVPSFHLARANLAVAYERLGDWKRALAAYLALQQAGALDPDGACSAAWILATGPDEELCDGEKAVELARVAVARRTKNAPEVLAAALARAGDFAEAAKVVEQLLERVDEARAKRELEERLALFRAEKPYTRPR